MNYTWDDLYELILTNWCNRLGISTTEAGFTIIAVSKVIASGLYLLVKMIDGLANNIWVGSMQAEKLLEVGPDKIGRGLNEAIQGEYTCSTSAKGVGDIPAGTTFIKEINGVTYLYESLALVAGGDDISIRALTAGTDCALTISDTLTAQKAPTYAEPEITVTAITETAVDTETIEEYRAVVVEYERAKLGNGNASDYVRWVANVTGLRTGYPYTADGEAGKAVIYCESTDNEVLIPSAGLIDDAVDAIKYDANGVTQPPVEFFEFVNTTYVLPVQITGVKLELTNGVSGEKTTIETLVRDYLEQKRPFLHTVNKYIQTTDGYNTYENTIAVVDIIQLLASNNITFTAIEMTVNILSAATYLVKTVYVVGYRGGTTYPTTLSTSNDPTLPSYYGECPRLEDVTFV